MPDEGQMREAGAEPLAEPASRRLPWRPRTRAQLYGAFAALGAALVLVAAGFHWWTEGRFHVTTDNAYVRADITIVSAKVQGYVRHVNVADNAAVRAGDALVELESADYEAAVAQARAQLVRAQAQAQSMAAQQALAAAELARYRPLARSGVISPAGMQQIQARALERGGDADAANAAIRAAEAAVAAAELNLARTAISAPIDGVVGDRQVRVGQLVQPGAPLLAIVPLRSVYVVANLKETQLTHIRPGQPATIRADVERGVALTGIVDSIAPASGSEFSIIPQDTATGNFTKIVQRVPVRIRLAAGEAARAHLRPGLSVTVDIDTRPARAAPR